MAELRLSFFGAARMTAADGETIKLRRRKALALAAYLAASEQPVRRETLAAMFWAEFDTRRARAGLRQILWELGATPLREFLKINRETAWLADAKDLLIDVREFRRLARRAENHEHTDADSCAECLENLTVAARLYHGDFLDGFGLGDSPQFDEWQFWQTENFRAAAIKIFARLIRLHERRGDFERAIDYARKLLALDATDEAGYQFLMRLYAASGQRSAALRSFKACVKTLRQELGALPQPETTELYERIKNGTLADFFPENAKFASGEKRIAAPRIPASAGTKFLGRERELAEIEERLGDPDCRLLTLTGAGGTGKTRLALEALKKFGAQFTGGVYFVSLAAAAAPELIVPVIADALGVKSAEGGETETRIRLLEFLRDKNALVALDNFEHLTSGASVLSEILQKTEALKFLTTSRELLDLRREWLLEIEGLEFPSARQSENSENVESFSAVRLFLQAAKRANAKFPAGAEIFRDIARICRAVEGLPLGIELAASWTRVLSCRQIADEIERGLDLLTTTARDIPAEHRSIRAVFERSWDFLTDEQRRVLRMLSVFRGGFQTDAAAAVAQANILTLSVLIDKSLLRNRTNGERCEMHELVRQFCAEKLGENPDEEKRARDLHCEYYSRRIGETAAGEAASGEIWEEIENARAGWRWAIANSKLKEIERCLDFIFRFYDLRGWFEEGYESFAQAAGCLGDVSGDEAGENRRILLGKLLVRKGIFAVLLGRNEEARRLFSKGLELFGAAELPEERAQALNRLGIVTYHLGDYRKAKKHLKDALALYRFLDDRRGAAQSLNRLAYLAGEIKDYAAAEKLLEESLCINRSLGGEKEIVDSLNDLGYALYLGGKMERADLLLKEGLAASRKIGYRRAVATTLDNLGCVAAARGAIDEARAFFDEALKTAMETGSLPIALDVLAGRAALLAREKETRIQALEILAFVISQPETWKVTKETARGVLSALEKDLPDGIFDDTVKSPARRDINQIIRLVFEKAV